MAKIRWGVLSTAKIGREKVIPAMQAGNHSIITAIGSANKEAAEAIAKQHNIAKVYNSYEALLADPDIDAVYNPILILILLIDHVVLICLLSNYPTKFIN